MRRIDALAHLRLLRFAQSCARRAASRAALRKSGSDLTRRHAGKTCTEPFVPCTRVRLTLPMFANICICGDSCIARGYALRNLVCARLRSRFRQPSGQSRSAACCADFPSLTTRSFVIYFYRPHPKWAAPQAASQRTVGIEKLYGLFL